MITQLMKYRDYDHEDMSSRIYGVVTALVTNNKDPDKMGRVKVKYPWMGEAKDKESYWARVTTFMAGEKRGGYFLPEVNDEVLVAFENGDINYPYVIGTLWNGKDKPIESNDDGKNNIKAIHSRSGHKIILDDTKDNEKFILKDKTGKRVFTFDVKAKLIKLENTEDKGEIKITSKGKMTIQSDDAMDIKAKKKITIKSNDDVEISGKNVTTKSTANMNIKSGAKLDIKATSSAKITANARLDMKGTAGAKLEASGTLDLKATGPTTVQSSAITSVKGSLVKIN
ncbi:MAG: phage baseplate assembly protein V [Campylobacterota bacterium]|nr:phage baseplate assembly protein V [Campylobacterota bacterium]